MLDKFCNRRRFLQTATLFSTSLITSLAHARLTSAGTQTYVLVNRSQYWDWYATSQRWKANSQVYLAQSKFPDQVYNELKGFLGSDPLQKTPNKRFYLLVNEQTGGGFASGYISNIGKGPGIGIAWDAWENKYAGHTYWSHELIAHETTNLFTGLVISGWPVDWWADDISPFPFMVKIKNLEALGYTDGAQKDRKGGDILTKMFLDLQTTYSWNIYRRMLKYITGDRWNSWDTLTASGGTNPSALRSSYVAAYLSLGAEKNLTNLLNKAFSAAHQVSHKAPGYTLDAQGVQKIIDRRNKLQGLPLNSTEWNDFRKGIV